MIILPSTLKFTFLEEFSEELRVIRVQDDVFLDFNVILGEFLSLKFKLTLVSLSIRSKNEIHIIMDRVDFN